jgi:hypothetical protein
MQNTNELKSTVTNVEAGEQGELFHISLGVNLPTRSGKRLCLKFNASAIAISAQADD